MQTVDKFSTEFGEAAYRKICCVAFRFSGGGFTRILIVPLLVAFVVLFASCSGGLDKDSVGWADVIHSLDGMPSATVIVTSIDCFDGLALVP